ncbi:basic helix-loop-helix (bHLH) DNA-binding superfamily protein [Actinidia rufa]|uniref:Basic helix-loop-helix (BHLH) DNA-binding superfamily protein n=1 Tax=Actinidia rufa TaxID=165716 RepID=A0A7J0G709_9ERIC|nr:basic helix-loop-helix (bHLH) DNA-binding superfamily protein [Actinidia rufa]
MVTPESTNWIFDYGQVEDIAVPDPNISVPASGFGWSMQPLSGSSNSGARPESCGASSSKACREKLRRDRLNDKFIELGSILEPGRHPKIDKAAILVDAVREAEKIELRDEKQRLKAEKDRLEQQLKMMNAQSGFLPPPPAIPARFAAQGQTVGNKLVPIISYPGVAMWQFMPPAAVDTSQDHVLRPPVA